MNIFFRIKTFLWHWLHAVDHHSLHSPFLFDLYTKALKAPGHRKAFKHIEELRWKLKHDPARIPVQELGTGHAKSGTRSISSIARTSLSPSSFSSLYYRLAVYFQATTILELGTSFGINALYLAEKKNATVTTIEGSGPISDVAARLIEAAPHKNIELVHGDIETALPAFLLQVKKIDMAFIDANHQYEPTIRYFDWMLKKFHDKSVAIIDDIHRSPDMERAWTTIRDHSLVYASADLYRCGIVFFDPSLNKQHVILQQ